MPRRYLPRAVGIVAATVPLVLSMLLIISGCGGVAPTVPKPRAIALAALTSKPSDTTLQRLLEANEKLVPKARATLATGAMHSVDKVARGTLLTFGKGESQLVAAVANYFPTSNADGYNPEATSQVGHVFDSRGELLWEVGAYDFAHSSQVRLLNFGPPEDWFIWVETVDEAGTFALRSDIYSMQDGGKKILSFRHNRDSYSFSVGPISGKTDGRISFFSNPRPKRVPIQAKCQDGKMRDAVLVWDTKHKAFAGCRKMFVSDTALFEVIGGELTGFIEPAK